MTSLNFRTASADDAEQIALLHADSWRRHYRGAYADSFLDGDVAADRRVVWSSRLATPGNTATAVAEDDTGLVGFIHVVFDSDHRWGSLVDDLHVVHYRQRTGIGAALLSRAAAIVARRATHAAIYLWVLEQNANAQGFYRANGGICVERIAVSPPGGVPTRLNGTPHKFRFSWPDAASLARPPHDR